MPGRSAPEAWLCGCPYWALGKTRRNLHDSNVLLHITYYATLRLLQHSGYTLELIVVYAGKRTLAGKLIEARRLFPNISQPHQTVRLLYHLLDRITSLLRQQHRKSLVWSCKSEAIGAGIMRAKRFSQPCPWSGQMVALPLPRTAREAHAHCFIRWCHWRSPSAWSAPCGEGCRLNIGDHHEHYSS